VGIQAGHWNIGQLPEEQARLRNDTGTRWGPLREVDVNLRIAEVTADLLRSAGVTVDLLPAMVPPGYDADAFVAIHADGGANGTIRGWKIAAPRRASAASRILRDSIARAYGAVTALPEDRYGVTFNMRGYYAFSWTRYDHAVGPATPSAIIETGYLTSAADRGVIVDDPREAATGIAVGIMAYLSERAGLPPLALVPLSFPPLVVSADNAAVRYFPDDSERVAAHLPAGTIVRPFDEINGWVELTVNGNFRVSGWMRRSDLQDTEGWS
jgi:N-acetylmuramoyl-L-alanine amidase